MSTELIVAALSGGGFASIIAAVVQSVVSRRKLGAEATKIITDAAAGVVQSMQRDLDRQRAENTQQDVEHREFVAALIASYEEENREWRNMLQLHVAWDEITRAELEKYGVILPAAPPLLPPRKFNHPAP